ncbi:hypothetical protein RGUI_3558 [Rhodovulum sp. P5]|nr:hypothetical protein RGUI_3558 [Rhodovulum sp. P5]
MKVEREQSLLLRIYYFVLGLLLGVFALGLAFGDGSYLGGAFVGGLALAAFVQAFKRYVEV